MPRFAPAAVSVAALIAVLMGAMYLRSWGNRILPPNLGSSSEFVQVRAIGCRWEDSYRIGGIIIDPVERTRSTWDAAHAAVEARGGSVPRSCDPRCLPDDVTKAWLVEVHGTFVPPPDHYPAAMVPDSQPANGASSTTPVAGTWFSIVGVLDY